MSLRTGSRLGPYEVVALIGVGGMGEVYRARDTKLKRDVALKVLPEVFSADPNWLTRFRQEAEVLASLSHSHIASIYGVHETEGTQALVLELVEGETLADRIARGPVPCEEALQMARQIADAVDLAHQHGVIHRDLKPANIRLLTLRWTPGSADLDSRIQADQLPTLTPAGSSAALGSSRPVVMSDRASASSTASVPGAADGRRGRGRCLSFRRSPWRTTRSPVPGGGLRPGRHRRHTFHR